MQKSTKKQMNNKEIIVDIQGYEGLYKVSSLGYIVRIKSDGRQKKISDVVSHYGYLICHLCKGGVAKKVILHRIVAMTFIPNPENKPQVNHINGIKTDNRVCNLEWATRSENMLHSYANGLHKTTDDMKRKLSIMAKSQVGANCPASRKVINTNTNEIFDRIKDAAKTIGMSAWSLGQRLNNNIENKTPFQFFR